MYTGFNHFFSLLQQEMYNV